MKHPEDPERGDMVRLDSRTGLRETLVFDTWNSSNPSSEFKSIEFALVLEDQHSTGGNGCKILTQDGRVGWVNVKFLERVK
jgi:hypothetical protein